MLEITVKNGLLVFGQDAIRYDGEGTTFAELKQMIGTWGARLRAAPMLGASVYLPFGISDDWIEAFEVEGDGDVVSLRAVELEAVGYTPAMDSLMDEIEDPRPRAVMVRRDQAFLTCRKSDLIDAIEALQQRLLSSSAG
jgi:hypothetical protein